MHKLLKDNKASRFILVLMICCLAVFVSSCTLGANETTEESESQILPEYIIYRANDSFDALVLETVNLDDRGSVETRIDNIFSQLLSEDETFENSITPIPKGMTYQRYSYDEDGNVHVLFSVDYENSDKYQMLLCKEAFTHTLCQIDLINKVIVEETDITDGNNVKTEEFDKDSFAELSEDMDNIYYTDVYYIDSQGKTLEMESEMLDLSLIKTMEEQVVDLLSAVDPTTKINTISNRVSVNNVYTEEGICYVDFSDSFLYERQGVDNQAIIDSLVKSLTSLPNVDGVKILVSGEDVSTLGKVDISGILTGDN